MQTVSENCHDHDETQRYDPQWLNECSSTHNGHSQEDEETAGYRTGTPQIGRSTRGTDEETAKSGFDESERKRKRNHIR